MNLELTWVIDNSRDDSTRLLCLHLDKVNDMAWWLVGGLMREERD